MVDVTGVFSRTDIDRTNSAGVGTSGTNEGDGSRGVHRSPPGVVPMPTDQPT